MTRVLLIIAGILSTLPTLFGEPVQPATANTGNDNIFKSFAAVVAESQTELDEVIEHYVKNEFFLALLPCYLFLGFAAYRYYLLKTGQGESLPSHEVQDSGIPPISYYIKVRLSYYVAGSYVLNILTFAIAGKYNNPFDLMAQTYSLCYLAAVIAWFASGWLIELERPFMYYQEYIGQRGFWILNFFIFFVKIFNTVEGSWFYFFLNFVRLVFAAVLLLYAIFKPYDKHEFERNHDFSDSEIPETVRHAFDYIETSIYVHYLVYWKTYRPPKKSLLGIRRPSEIRIELIDVLSKSKVHDTEENIRKKMPRVAISIKKQLLQKTTAPIGGSPDITKDLQAIFKGPMSILTDSAQPTVDPKKELMFFYCIETRVISKDSENSYYAERRYAEFQQLEACIQEKLSFEKYPMFHSKVPLLKSVLAEDYNCNKEEFVLARIQALENFLNELFVVPIFVTDKVMDFLNITAGGDRGPFEHYFRLFENNQQEFANKYAKLLKDRYTTPQPGASAQNSNQKVTPQANAEGRIGTQTTPQDDKLDVINISISSPEKRSILSVSDTAWEKAPRGVKYTFSLTLHLNALEKTWTITKDEEDFERLNNRLNNKIGKLIPASFQIGSMTSSARNKQGPIADPPNIEQRCQKLRECINFLVKSKEYHSEPLFAFLEMEDSDTHALMTQTASPGPMEMAAGRDSGPQVKHIHVSPMSPQLADEEEKELTRSFGDFGRPAARKVTNYNFFQDVNNLSVKVYAHTSDDGRKPDQILEFHLEETRQYEVAARAKLLKSIEDIERLHNQLTRSLLMTPPFPSIKKPNSLIVLPTRLKISPTTIAEIQNYFNLTIKALKSDDPRSGNQSTFLSFFEVDQLKFIVPNKNPGNGVFEYDIRDLEAMEMNKKSRNVASELLSASQTLVPSFLKGK